MDEKSPKNVKLETLPVTSTLKDLCLNNNGVSISGSDSSVCSSNNGSISSSSSSSFQDANFNKNSVSISLCSSISESSHKISLSRNADSVVTDYEESQKSNLDANECSGFKSFCPSKPHKGNDIRWDAIQHVKGKDGDLALAHFRLLKKLGCGDIGSVYLAELRGMGCLFAMKVMDKGMLAGRKKLIRAQTEREILSSLDHPFLPTLYSHFETEKFSCLLMEFCSGGDLHILRQRQLGKHFSETAARLVSNLLRFNMFYFRLLVWPSFVLD